MSNHPNRSKPTYTPTTRFDVPPECAGQIVEYSYALDAEAQVILECVYDGSDQSTEYYAYAYPRNDDGSWEPWNGKPRLGRSMGRCRVSFE